MSLDDPDMPPTQARMGKVVPNFVGESTEGVLDFHQWLGNSWGILFSHPAPFTPICTTEMGAMAFEHEVRYYFDKSVKFRTFHNVHVHRKIQKHFSFFDFRSSRRGTANFSEFPVRT